MIKAMVTDENGKQRTLVLGLSFANLNRFIEQPGDTFIRISGMEVGLPCDLMIISGKTEADMVELLKDGITLDTKVHVTYPWSSILTA